MYLFPLFLPYMFRALISPSSGVSQAVLHTTIWFMWCLCCSSAYACGLVCRGGFTVQNKQLHPLVTLLQCAQKMHGMNNLKMFHQVGDLFELYDNARIYKP